MGAEHAHGCSTECAAASDVYKRQQQDLDPDRARHPSVRPRLEPPCECPLRVVAKLVHLGDAVHAADRTHRRAVLYTVILTLEIRRAIGLQRKAGTAALLRTPVDQPVFAHVQIAAARAAVPVLSLI